MLLLLAACGGSPHVPADRWRSSSAELALSPDGTRLAAVNPDSGTLTLVNASTLTIQAEVPVGADPKAVAFTPGGASVLVTAARAGTLSVVQAASAQVAAQVVLGGQPFGVVADARRAYVALFARGEVAVIDLAGPALIDRLAVEPFPAGLALAGGTLYVTHLYTGRVTVVDLTTLTPAGVLALDPEANLAQAAIWSADGASLWLPLTLSHAANRDLRPETAVSPVVMGLNLTTTGMSSPAHIDLYSPEGAVNLPWAAAASPDGRWLFVANAGTDDIAVVDLSAGRLMSRLAVGRSPRGLALAADGRRLYVSNALDGTLSVLDVAYQVSGLAPIPRLSQQAVLHIAEIPLEPQLLEGKRLFYSARPPLSNGWLSCATCHFEGGHDARTWLGFPGGRRNTPALFGAAETAPYHWNGDLDELQDVEQTIRSIQGGSGLLDAGAEPALGQAQDGRSAALDALAAYVAALPMPPAPEPADPELMRRGLKAFERWGCGACHPAPLFTDRDSHQLERDQIGEAALRLSLQDLRFDTPSLLGVWATAPYFHDGSAATLNDTLFRAGFHGMGWAMDASEREALLAFLGALPVPDAAAR